MAATAEEILAIARRELGNTEFPANSNQVKYNTWYYGRAVSGSAYPWCMAFVQWVFAQAKAPELLPARTASCGALMKAAQKAGVWVARDFRPGDVVIYDFSGRRSATEHTGIVELSDSAGVTAIEGNTSQAGSQSNGGQVCRKIRSSRLIVGAVRPQYKEEKRMDNTPDMAHKEGVEWARKYKILNGSAAGDLMLSQPVTRQQFCTMLYNYHKSLGGKS